MAELSMDLKRLESVGSALDIIRFLHAQPAGYADSDDIMEGLDISERRFGKAVRRLVTTGYIQMRSDYVYELTTQGVTAADELAAFDAAAPADSGIDSGLQRKILIAVPRSLVASKPSSLHIGFPPDSAFQTMSQVVVQISAVHADLDPDADIMLDLGTEAVAQQLSITPQAYDQVRLRLQAYQLSPNGDDVSPCGGMYVDVDVVPDGEPGGLIAYGVDLTFT